MSPIRPAALRDVPEIAALSDTLGYPGTTEAIAERLGHLLNRPDHFVAVAELSPGQVVGWLHATDLEFLESGRHGEILGLVVGAAHRGQGIGRSLVAAAEAWALGRGLDRMGVRSNVVRIEAHPFYVALGYTRAKTQHAYRKELRGTPGHSPT